MKFLRRASALQTKTIIFGCILGFIVMMIGGLTTEAAFRQVNYPGSDFGGVPLTFNLEVKKTNLTILEEYQTLDLFLQVQYLDFGIVIGTLSFFTFLALWLTKAFQPSSFFHKTGRFAAALFLSAPLMDAFENVSQIILIILRNQNNLSWLSFLNSCFTLGKMSCFILGWFFLGILLIALIVARLNRQFFHAGTV